jgi:hypothetical protein
MEKNRFDELVNNDKILLFAGLGGAVISDKKNQVAIELIFGYNGLPHNFNIVPKKRIYLSAFSIEDFSEAISTFPMADSIIVVGNADMEDYAISYELTTDLKQRRVRLKLLDMPELGEQFITDEEKAGIEVKY